MKIAARHWLFSLPAAMFYCLATTTLASRIGSSSIGGTLAFVLAHYLFLNSITLWVLADARQNRRQIPYDFDSFIFFAWVVAVPFYLFSTRGWRGLIPIGWFTLIYVGAAMFGQMPNWLPTMHQ